MRKAGLVISIILLLVSGVVGLKNAAREWDDPGTALMKSVHFGVALYGVLGLLGASGVTTALRRLRRLASTPCDSR